MFQGFSGSIDHHLSNIFQDHPHFCSDLLRPGGPATIDASGRGQRGGLSADGGSEGPKGHATIHGKKSWDNIGEP
jgi:hypothetical protein